MISKSDFLKYIQCYKYLWLYKNRKDLIPEDYQARFQKIFDEGFKVEDYAYKLFPGAIDAYDPNFRIAINKTRSLIEEKKGTIIQPSISGNNLFSRCDIIKYNSRTKKWDIYEIKASLGVKDEHIVDLSFQKVCLEANNIILGDLYLIHVNRDYVKKGEIEPRKFLLIEKVTDKVEELTAGTSEEIKKALKLVSEPDEPKIRILDQCRKPYECQFINYCWKNISENSIYLIAKHLSVKKLNLLLDQGIIDINQVPPEMVTSKKGKLHFHAIKHNQVYIEQDEIKKHLNKLVYPLYFFDYETYGYDKAVPVEDGFGPYEQYAFQYSVHVKESPTAKLKHYEFLADKFGNPEKELAESLAKVIGPKGSVIAWNARFEMGCNEAIAKRFPKYKKFFESVNKRMFDLMVNFSEGHYVHKNFQGSASLKKVLPVLVPKLSYQDLDIGSSSAAPENWGKMVRADIPEKEKKQIYKNLLEYCKLDTLAMVEILKVLEKTIDKSDN